MIKLLKGPKESWPELRRRCVSMHRRYLTSCAHRSAQVAMVSMPFLGALLTNSIIHKSQYRSYDARISNFIQNMQ
jgi:hypothetical protein